MGAPQPGSHEGLQVDRKKNDVSMTMQQSPEHPQWASDDSHFQMTQIFTAVNYPEVESALSDDGGRHLGGEVLRTIADGAQDNARILLTSELMRRGCLMAWRSSFRCLKYGAGHAGIEGKKNRG